MFVCMCVTSVSIPHFVPIISKGMWHNTTIHTSIRATEATASENEGLREQEAQDADLTEMKKKTQKRMI